MNDDELNGLLAQARRVPLEPREAMNGRVFKAYQADLRQRTTWRRPLLRSIAIPWPVAVLAAALLVFSGVLLGLRWRSAESPGPGKAATSSQSTTVLTFQEFQPVSQIRPRTMRSWQHDQ